MKQTFTLLMTLLCLSASHATDYYFSSATGDDSRSPQQASNQNTPWKSIDKLNSFFQQLQPGDKVLFKNGEEFSGTIRGTRSGNAGNPITFGAWGTGSKPVLSGFLNLTNWINKGGNIWEADCAAPNGVGVVAISGENRMPGRYPNFNTTNGGYMRVESHNGQSTIYSNALSGFNWQGGEAVIRKNRWIIDRDRISSHNGNNISLNASSSYEATNTYGFFIQNHMSTLDLDGEWYHNKATGKMYLYSNSNPAGRGVRASTVEHTVIIHNHSFFRFENISFEGSNLSLVRLINTNDIIFNECNFQFGGNEGLAGFTALNTAVNNSTISDINNIGLKLDSFSRYGTFRNNKFRRIAWKPGMGGSGDESYHALISRGNNAVIEQNSFDSVGYVVIRFEGNDVLVKNNFLQNFLMAKDDGAAIYTWKGERNRVLNSNRKVVGNIILNGRGESYGTENNGFTVAAGIYLDDNADNVDLIDNTVAHCSYAGLYIHNSHTIKVQGNTFYDNGNQVSLSHDYIAPTIPLRNLTFTDNVLFAKTAQQVVMKVVTIKDDISQMGFFDKNHYNRPNDADAYIQTSIRKNNMDIHELLDTDAWRTRFNHDLLTKKSPLLILPIITSKLLGNTKINNGTYNNGLTTESCWSPIGDCRVGWNRNSKLDGGALEVSFNSPGADNKVFLTFNPGVITAGKKYAVKFSMAGKPTVKSMRVYLRKDAANYDELTDVKSVKITEGRSENTIYLSSIKNETNAVLVFEIIDPLGTIWIDNITLHEAEVSETQSNQNIRFEYNAAMNNRSFVLNESSIDGRGAYRTGAVELNPFGSVVLIENNFIVLANEFLKLNANWASADVKLNWTASNSRMLNSFEVERSADQQNYTPIATINADHSRIDPNLSEISFNYDDRLVTGKNNFYRIKSIATDGKILYSNTVYLAATTAKPDWKLYPNPANEKIRLQLNQVKFKSGKVTIYNIAGVEVHTSQLKSDTQFAEIDISALSEGSYILRVRFDDQVINKEFVKVAG